MLYRELMRMVRDGRLNQSRLLDLFTELGIRVDRPLKLTKVSNDQLKSINRPVILIKDNK